MANKDRREALRGAEDETFDLLAEVLTSEQRAELLKAPLERAAIDGNKALALKLARAGAEVGQALYRATRAGHGGVVSDLLDNGASVATKRWDGQTPLHIAAQEGNAEIVQLLMLKGADKDAMNSNDWTPLFQATWHGNVAAALALMAAGADVSLPCGKSWMLVVHLAAERGYVDIMRAAIERGADVDAVDRNQYTPLTWAVIGDEAADAVGVLLQAGANIEARDDTQSTPLHMAASFQSRSHVGPIGAWR